MRIFLFFIAITVSVFANVNVVCKAGIMDNQSAKRYINKLLKKEPENIECILKLADVHLKSGELMRGYEQIVKAYNINPDSVKNSSVANVLPDALEMTSLYKQAEKTNNLETWNTIAEVFFKMGAAKEASKAYKKSLEIDPKQEEIALKLALSYKRMKESDLAVGSLEKLLKYHPESFYGNYYLAKLLRYDYDEHTKAKRLFIKAKTTLNKDEGLLPKEQRSRFLYDLEKEIGE